MGTFCHKTTLNLLLSQSPASLPESIDNYVSEPDLSAVGSGVGSAFVATTPQRYWKWDIPGWSSETVVVMTAGEQTAVDDAIAAAALTADRASEKTDLLRRGMKALVLVIMREINILRGQHSLADRTESQLRNAIDDEIDLQ